MIHPELIACKWQHQNSLSKETSHPRMKLQVNSIAEQQYYLPSQKPTVCFYQQN